uniref:Endonuclease/exonuclease/phosphatase family protein n=1 Tax=Roseihalotalea indica TaxID=2867963 RepID=A0AA49GP83_9BACT|nr:endonuclease/exonuclease/phosphatase family protein [Tunicatimonas sp. TK19036]
MKHILRTLACCILGICLAGYSRAQSDLIITGVVDGPLTGGIPKAIEIYALSDIADLSSYGLGSANNGGGSDGEEFTFPADAVSAGEYLYIATESPGFNNFFGFTPDYISGSAASINGDDAIELFQNGVVVDIFGDIDASGSNQAWEYTDGWAYRQNGTGPDGSTFQLDNWLYSGTDALDGETTNASASTPFPLGTYQPDGDGGPGETPVIVINEIDADQNSTDAAEFIELYDGGAGNTSLDGFVVVLFNGNGDVAYDAIDLDGNNTDENGYFVIGSATVPNVDLVEFTTNGLQNGPDAVALYEGNAADFPSGTPITLENLLDAIVYDTSDDDDAELLTLLNENQPQVDENENGSATTESVQRFPNGTGGFRNTQTYAAFAPTPGAENVEPEIPVASVAIYEIQGDGDDFTSPTYASPLVGQPVKTQGVVTAIASNGFYMQDATGDGNEDTSDGILVFTGSAPSVAIGDLLEVTGTVSEYFEATQLEDVTDIAVIGTGSITPLVLGVDRQPPTEIVDDAGSTDYDPTRDGRDFWESLEGMLVTLPNAQAVSLTNNFGEVYAISGNDAYATGENARGGITILDDDDPNNPIGADLNPERIQIDPPLPSGTTPEVNIGDLLGDITGVVGYGFDDYAILPISPVNAQSGGNSRETTSLTGTADQLTLAGYNVENLDPSDDRFEAIANQIINYLKTPDVIALQEVQDNDGADNTSVTSADQTLQAVVDAISAAGGPTYAFIDNPFIGDDTNGGEPGGNIRVAYLYNSDRVSLVEGSLQTVVDPTDQQTNPDNPFYRSRLPLVATFTFNSQTITIINNHFSSKGGSDPLFGDEQPPANGGLNSRIDQAEAVNTFVAELLAEDADAKVAVLGDFNEFQFFEPLEILEENLVNLTKTLDETERYSYNFEGNAQALDHILVSASLAGEAEYDVVHINSEFIDMVSDHDPPLARLTLARNPIVVTPVCSTIPAKFKRWEVKNTTNERILVFFSLTEPSLPRIHLLKPGETREVFFRATRDGEATLQYSYRYQGEKISGTSASSDEACEPAKLMVSANEKISRWNPRKVVWDVENPDRVRTNLIYKVIDEEGKVIDQGRKNVKYTTVLLTKKKPGINWYLLQYQYKDETGTVIEGEALYEEGNSPVAREETLDKQIIDSDVDEISSPMAFEVNVFPNPIQEEVFVTVMSNNPETASLKVYDAIGKLVYNQHHTLQVGNNQLTLNAAQWNTTAKQLILQIQLPSQGLKVVKLMCP